MKDKVDNPSAFPLNEYLINLASTGQGMTLLDYFAGKALAGCIANTELCNYLIGASVPGDEFAGLFADRCYIIADAMLKVRAKYE